MTDQLVSVVIPAHNAQETIDETLRSVRAQTHRTLEILVVDDGSGDNTIEIVRRHRSADPRVVLIQQPNAGVAAARNTGWRAASSDLIAFIDADDLWAPNKIERQLAALKRANDRVGLVYCWSWTIDGASKITEDKHRPVWRGSVLERLLLGNFIGNGSAALVRRQALVDADGFESRLRAADAQGCEDVLFYCRVAERYEFEVVEEALVGYRYLPGNMSSDMPRMLRSWMLVIEEMLARHPGAAAVLRQGLRLYAVWLLKRAVALKQPRNAASVLSTLARHRPLAAARVIAVDLPWLGIRHFGSSTRRLLRGRRSVPDRPPFATRFQIGELR